MFSRDLQAVDHSETSGSGVSIKHSKLYLMVKANPAYHMWLRRVVLIIRSCYCTGLHNNNELNWHPPWLHPLSSSPSPSHLILPFAAELSWTLLWTPWMGSFWGIRACHPLMGHGSNCGWRLIPASIYGSVAVIFTTVEQGGTLLWYGKAGARNLSRG